VRSELFCQVRSELFCQVCSELYCQVCSVLFSPVQMKLKLIPVQNTIRDIISAVPKLISAILCVMERFQVAPFEMFRRILFPG
jgi:hypothetical protein